MGTLKSITGENSGKFLKAFWKNFEYIRLTPKAKAKTTRSQHNKTCCLIMELCTFDDLLYDAMKSIPDLKQWPNPFGN